MHQREWLAMLCSSRIFPYPPLNPGLCRVWVLCPVEDDADALGCVLMGGEL